MENHITELVVRWIVLIKLENKKVNRDKYYSAGYSIELRKYIS